MDESLIYRVPAQPKNPLEDFEKEKEPSQIFSAMPEKSVEPAKTVSAYQEPVIQKSSNPLESLPEAKTQTEQPDEPPSIGKIISDGHTYISQVKALQAGRTGRNAREVQREKALDNQAIFQAYSAMQARLSERGYDPRLVDVLGTNKGGGFRTAEDIDRLFKIKAEGLQYQTQDGNIAKLEKNAPWQAILDAADEVGGITIMKPSDPLKTAQEEVNLFKGYSEAKQIAVDNPEDQNAQIAVRVLGSRIKEAMGPERFAKAEFDYGQENFAAAVKFGDQKVDLKGNPVEGLESKTASQVAADMVATRMIPVVDFTVNEKGEPGFDTNALNSQFPGGKPIEGAYVAFRNPQDGTAQTHRIVNGIPTKLPSNSTQTPVKEKPAPAEGNPFRVEAEAAQTARGTQDLEDEIYGIQVKMEELDKKRYTLTERRNAAKDPFLGREFPRGISAGQAADEYDAITAKMRELAGKRTELLAKRRAIKNQR